MRTNPHADRFESAFKSHIRSERLSYRLLCCWAVIIGSAGVFLIYNQVEPIWEGAALALVPVSFLQLYSGVRVLRQCDKSVKSMSDFSNEISKETIEQESLRAESALRGFQKSRQIVSLLFFLGLLFLLIGGFSRSGDFMTGSGLGLSLQAGILLAFELFASMRTSLFQHELKVFKKTM